MTVAIEKTVRELAVENPASTRVFEKLGSIIAAAAIDRCAKLARVQT